MRRGRLAAILAAGGVLALGGGWMVAAQTNQTPAGANETSGGPAPPGVPVIQPPPEPVTPPAAAPPAEVDNDNDTDTDEGPATNTAAKPQVAAKPVPPPTPVRSPAAILQALDKVTAETMRFAAPVGQRVRYKNLVFTVKACETTGLDQPEPQSSAYVVVESQPVAIQGAIPAPAKVVYRGWMFSDSPGLHPLQHPVYDAWLIACMASVPPA